MEGSTPLKDPKPRKTISYICFRILRWLLWLVYPKVKVKGTENLPDGACIVVGNHTKMNGPIIAEIHFPGKRKIWCAGEMMVLREVPAYAYQDFWSEKPRYIRWYYHILSYLLAPLCACIFTNANTIAVRRDSRIISTFKQTVQALQNDERVIIFPECYTPHNHIVNKFQDNFVEVARLYHKHTGKSICFVPMYIAPALKQAHLGKPIAFRPDAPADEERTRICEALMQGITDIAVSLPRHRVVPYENLPKKYHAYNISSEEAETLEKTGC